MKTKKIKSGWISLSRIAAMLLVVLSVSFTFYSCEGEEESSSGNCETELMALADIVSDKAEAMSANGTAANCSALRTATLNMIAKAEACGQGNIHAESKAYWQNLDCNAEFD